MGSRRVKLHRAEVLELATLQLSVEEIAEVLGTKAKVLVRRFAFELQKGKAYGVKIIREKQFRLAEEGNVVMLIWLGKNILGQADKNEVKQESKVSGHDSLAIDTLVKMLEGLVKEKATTIAQPLPLSIPLPLSPEPSGLLQAQ